NAANTIKLKAKEYYCIILAALLHDADDRKFFGDSNYKNARYLLRKIPEGDVELVVHMIDLVSTSKNGNSTPVASSGWLLIPRYCDRLEAVGKIGIERCL